MDPQLALTAAIAAALMTALWRLARARPGCAARKSGTEATIAWTGSYSAAFQRALDICGLMEVEVGEANPNGGFITARLTPLVGSATLRITLRTQEGVTTVTVSAQAMPRLPDLGASRRIVNRFIEVWNRMPDPAP